LVVGRSIGIGPTGPAVRAAIAAIEMSAELPVETMTRARMAAMMAYSDDAPEMGSGHGVRGGGMGQWPWEYLFVALNDGLGTFYTPFWVTNLALFLFTIVAYAFGTRRGRGHGTLGDEWEFLLWTGLATFGLNLVYAAFQWYGLFPIITTAVGLFVMRDAVTKRFPPLLVAEDVRAEQLRVRRQVSAGIEATIKRPKRRAGR
jgi:hypothetical protein